MSVQSRRRRFYASYGCGDNDNACVARATISDSAGRAFAARRVDAFAKQAQREPGPLTSVLRYISPIGTTTAVFRLKGEGAQKAEALEQLQNRGVSSYFTGGLSEALFKATGEQSVSSLGEQGTGSKIGGEVAPYVMAVSAAAGAARGDAFGGKVSPETSSTIS